MTQSLWDIEAMLARAAIGAPFEVSRAWHAGAMRLAISNDVAVSILASCVLWADRGNKLNEIGVPELRRYARLSLIARDSWFDSGFFEPATDEMWSSPLWGPTHLARATVCILQTDDRRADWQQAFSAWSSFTATE